jgi:hypothetical protein
VSLSVLLVLCALLIVAGGVSLLAAAMGNPIRIGPVSVPGPDGALERAVIGVLGAVCVAAVVPVVLMGRTPPDERFVAANSATTPEPSATRPAASPTASPTPPVGPSAASAAPGVPTVTTIAVGDDGGTGCAHTFTAIVHISNGPVPVRYRAYVDGAVVGDPNRSKTISGTGGRTLDSVQVTATRSGPVTVRFDILGPNPTILSGTANWTAPAACDPAPPTSATATTPPPPTPTLGVGLSLPPDYDGLCASGPQFIVTMHITIGAGPTPTVAYHLSVDSTQVLTGSVSQTSDVPYVAGMAAGKHTVVITADSATTNPTTATNSGSFTVTCTDTTA